MFLLRTARLMIGVLPFIYIGGIWYLSSHPSDAIINTGFPFDGKLKEAMHFVEFGVLYLLIALGLRAFGKLNEGSSQWAALVALLFGLLDEVHQYYVPSRSATVTDFLKDGVGVFVAWGIVVGLIVYRKGNNRVESRE